MSAWRELRLTGNMHIIKKMGIYYIQGYFFDKPMCIESSEENISDKRGCNMYEEDIEKSTCCYTMKQIEEKMDDLWSDF